MARTSPRPGTTGPHVPARRTRPGRILWAAVIDVVAVIVFVVLGRASHQESASFGGFLVTVWPFLAALAIGWLAGQAWKHPFRLTLPGIPLWVITVVGGMTFRVASSQGIAVPFIIVAALVLGVFLLGWRAVATAITRRSDKADAADARGGQPVPAEERAGESR